MHGFACATLLRAPTIAAFTAFITRKNTMKGDPKVIEHLQAQLKNELTAINPVSYTHLTLPTILLV